MSIHHEYISFPNEGSRNDIRMNVVNAFAKEEPGRGTGKQTSMYLYYVEKLADGRNVFLQRPANLHNGFDFVINVENTNFSKTGRKREYPKHEELIADLGEKQSENLSAFEQLFAQLKRVYECKEPNMGSINKLAFAKGHPCDLLIYVLKWMFIEQDIRYWNYSGRRKLWETICRALGR